MIEITFQCQRDGCVHYRVLASREEDWSGWASDMDEALKKAVWRKNEIIERCGDIMRCIRCNSF